MNRVVKERLSEKITYVKQRKIQRGKRKQAEVYAEALRQNRA